MRRVLTALILSLMVARMASATLTITKLGASGAPTSSAVGNCPETGSPPVNSCWGLTITSTTSGAGLIVIVLFNITTDNFAGATPKGCFDGGDTFTINSSFRSTGSGGATGICYTLAVTGGKTTVFASDTGNTVPLMAAYQVTFTNSPLSFDAASSTTRTSATSFAGIAPTITGTSEVVFQAALCGSTCSAINSSYTGDFTSGDGTAYKVTTSTAAPNWTQSPAGTAVVAVASFHEASASSPTSPAQVY